MKKHLYDFSFTHRLLKSENFHVGYYFYYLLFTKVERSKCIKTVKKPFYSRIIIYSKYNPIVKYFNGKHKTKK